MSSKPNIQKPRRAVMYVPGDDLKKLNKIQSLKADCILVDCEDGVAYDKKEEARDMIFSMHNKIAADSKNEVGIRINSPSSGLASDDLKALFSMESLPSCLTVPKIDTYQEMNWICNELKKEMSFAQSKIKLNEKLNLIFMCESGQSLIDIKKIIEAGIASSVGSRKQKSFFQVAGIIFGSDDFCADLEITRSEDASELTYARQKLVATAKAYQLQVIDMVYINYKDSEGLRKQSLQGARMGFTGKQVIHPNQVETVQECFSPSKEKFEWAKQLMEEYELSENKGVFTFRGQMIDMPTILQARNILQLFENLKS